MESGPIFVDILNREFELRLEKNPRYSMRAFARDLNLSPASLSLVLKRKQGLSDSVAKKISTKLGLGIQESELLILSVNATHARSKKNRDLAKANLQLIFKSRKRIQKLHPTELSLTKKWYFFAILECLELPDSSTSANWFSKKLGLNITLVRQILKQLESMNWIRRQDSKYVAVHQSSETSNDLPSVAIRNLHEDFLKKAESALYENQVSDREFLNMTLAFQTKDLLAAKAFIRDTQSRFAEKFYQPTELKDSVYQLSIQFYRLDKKGPNI